MRPRTTLILALSALVAWGVWLIWLREAPDTEQRRANARLLLPGFEAGGVDRITMERSDGAIVLTRSGASWKLELPAADAADGAMVDSLLSALADAKVVARVAAEEIKGGDEATGLARGATRLILQGPGGRRALTLGSVDIPGGRRYVRVEGGGQLALVERGLAESVARPPDEFRDHDLFRLAPMDIRRWQATQSGRPDLDFERRSGDRWWITAPLADAADGTLVSGSLSRIVSLRADHFLDKATPDADLGLEPASATVRLFDRKGALAGALFLGQEIPGGDGKRYGRVDGRTPRFVVYAAELLHELSREPAGFRSKAALDFSAFDVAEFEIDRGATAVRVCRRPGGESPSGGDGWTVVAPVGFPLDGKKVDDFLSRLARVESLRFADGVDAATAGLSSPAARLTIAGEDASRLPRTVLEIGAVAGAGEVYARRGDRPAILVLDERTARDIDPAAIKR